MDIIEAIESIKEETDYENPIYTFTHGKCLVFAQMLDKIMRTGEIIYLKEEVHFVYSYNGKIYDVNGNVTRVYRNSTKTSIKKLDPRFIDEFEHL